MIEQHKFIIAFQNYFHNDDIIKRIQEIGESLEMQLNRNQAKLLLEYFWEHKKIKDKKHFNEISDEEVSNWLIDFVKENE